MDYIFKQTPLTDKEKNLIRKVNSICSDLVAKEFYHRATNTTGGIFHNIYQELGKYDYPEVLQDKTKQVILKEEDFQKIEDLISQYNWLKIRENCKKFLRNEKIR
jgi:hypothetical protein